MTLTPKMTPTATPTFLLRGLVGAASASSLGASGEAPKGSTAPSTRSARTGSPSADVHAARATDLGETTAHGVRVPVDAATRASSTRVALDHVAVALRDSFGCKLYVCAFMPDAEVSASMNVLTIPSRRCVTISNRVAGSCSLPVGRWATHEQEVASALSIENT